MQSKLNGRARWRASKAGVAGMLLSFLAVTAAAPAVAGPAPTWTKQLGSDSSDNFEAVASDSAGNVVAVGGFDNDPWVVKFSAAGAVLWQKKPGPAKAEQANGVAIDKSGNVIVSATTSYPFDTWITKYNSSGGLVWTKRFDSGTNDFAYRVAVDGLGNVYTAGTNGPLGNGNKNAVLVKYNSAGVQQWSKFFGTDQLDECNGIAADKNNNILLVGTTWGPFAGPDPSNTSRDAWIAKVDGTGKFLWTKQLDSLDADIDYGNAIAVDASGNVLVGGLTYGRFNAGSTRGTKAWLAKYSAGGAIRWIREYAPVGRNPDVRSLAVDSTGKIITTGRSKWSHYSDGAYVAKYSSAGAFLWDSFIDSGDGDSAQAVAVDGAGNAYVAGYTYGDLAVPNIGRTDSFLAKFPQ
ncbi:MAG: SBBP repeat-containing protein [Rhodospirillales bacterium]|nr:SBBP repeat-containing protein [Rhodospirillales bacterium]